MIYIYTCDHSICYNCIYQIYWDYSYLLNKPNNPLIELSKPWDLFLKTRKGNYITKQLINKILFNYLISPDSFDTNYEYYIININLKGISKIIKDNFKELIYYQVKLKSFLQKNINEKNIMESSIKICPYCKSNKI